MRWTPESWLYLGGGIILMLVAYDYHPALGGVFLALIVLLLLSHAFSRGYLSNAVGS